MDSENGNKILGIWISIFLDFDFWRDFGFSPQEGFGEECGLLVLYDNLEYNTMEYYNKSVMPRAIYTKEHNAIVERLKKARLEAGLGQVEVAKKLGKTQSYLSKIESGQRRFDVLQLKEFAKLYKKSLDFFVK